MWRNSRVTAMQQQEDAMPTIERSIDVQAEMADVDREWTQFTYRTLIGHYRSTDEDVEWSLAEDVEKSGQVAFSPLDGGGTRVTVTVDSEGDAAAQAAVAAHLERDLVEFEAFAEPSMPDSEQLRAA
jgi:hypothetical protein